MEGGDGRDVPSASQAREAKMDAGNKEDVLLLEDEKFDFDLSLSSSSANEDDEVFFGAVGHKERCIAASLRLGGQVSEQALEAASGSPVTWSPLTGEKFVEVYKEAHLLALQIESHSRREVAQAANPPNPVNQDVERFLQDSKLKISLFEKEQKREKSPMSLKRETFCLPPSGVQPLLGETQLLASPALLSSPVPAGPIETQSNQDLPCSSQPLPGEARTSQPPHQAGPPRRITSKLQPPRALPVRGKHLHLATEKLKKEVPTSVQRMKPPSQKGSQSDVPLDKPSTASDAASRGSRPGKRSLPVPSKSGLKKTLLKPPGYTSSLTRKSSASGSTSSLTSGACVSPASKAKSSDLSNMPANSSRPLPNTSKLGKIDPATLHQPLPAGPARASCKQAKGADAAQTTVEQPKASILTPLSQPPQTPEQRGPRLGPDTLTSSQLNKTSSVKRQDSYLNCKTVSTDTNLFKVPQFSVGESADGMTPKFSRTHRLQSWTPTSRVISSTPVRRSLGPTSQGLPSSVRTPMSARRMSMLPTPASRRLSGLPLKAPQSMPRALASPLCVSARRLSSEPRRRSTTVRAEPTQESSSSGQGRGLFSDESSSPPSTVPQALDFSPEKSDFPPSHGSTAVTAQGEVEPQENTSPSEVH
ncbi:G2 and S phase-expressed protein 1 [Lemmus lemmus]